MEVAQVPAWKLAIYGRAVTGSGQRKTPNAETRRAILDIQSNRCLYCELEFGTTIRRGSKMVTLRLNWDHFVPYAYGLTNASDNWVAACHVCNGIKSCRMFDTVGETQRYIRERWTEKGYETIFEPTFDAPVASPLLRTSETPESAVEPRQPVPVPIELAAYAHIVSRRLSAEATAVNSGRVTSRGGSAEKMCAALNALVASGHVQRRFNGKYWSARPFVVADESELLYDVPRPEGGEHLGLCPRCRQWRSLRTSGRIRRHQRVALTVTASTLCEGSGEWPDTQTDTTEEI